MTREKRGMGEGEKRRMGEWEKRRRGEGETGKERNGERARGCTTCMEGSGAGEKREILRGVYTEQSECAQNDRRGKRRWMILTSREFWL